MKTLIVIGLILTGVFTLPALMFLFLYGATLIYRDLRERPDAKPLSKYDFNGLLKDKGSNSGYAEPKDEQSGKE